MTRTADDSWDLASSVGATATAVAASRAAASKGPGALLDDPWAEPLVRAVGMDTFIKVVEGDDAAAAADDDPLLNRQAMNEQMAVRTRYFDDFFTTATASGIRQAVILASGLDTRAYRLPWPAGTVVYEIDQPEVIAFKTRTLAEGVAAGGFRPPHTDGVERRGALGIPATRGAGRLFDNITELSAPGSQIATEHMDTSEIPDDWADKLTERTKRIGSGINLAELFYTGDRNGAAHYLSSQGWQNAILPTAEAYSANGFELPDDELATFGGDSGYLTATLN